MPYCIYAFVNVPHTKTVITLKRKPRDPTLLVTGTSKKLTVNKTFKMMKIFIIFVAKTYYYNNEQPVTAGI
jgi:hypothetical protein